MNQLLPSWPPDWPEIEAAVRDLIASGQWGSYRGETTDRLQSRLIELSGARHCRLVCSGSIGVELALLSVGTAPGQEVILCGYDYPGNFRAVELVGARPVLVDPAPHSFSPSASELAAAASPNVSAVIVSHLYGVPAEIGEIKRLCAEREWKLIEDACQCPGTKIGELVAGGTGDVGVLSFGGSKPLSAGCGGSVALK